MRIKWAKGIIVLFIIMASACDYERHGRSEYGKSEVDLFYRIKALHCNIKLSVDYVLHVRASDTQRYWYFTPGRSEMSYLDLRLYDGSYEDLLKEIQELRSDKRFKRIEFRELAHLKIFITEYNVSDLVENLDNVTGDMISVKIYEGGWLLTITGPEALRWEWMIEECKEGKS